ncbi:MAG: hypothetical protein VW870_04145 [Rhodobiaceae bacterium]
MQQPAGEVGHLVADAGIGVPDGAALEHGLAAGRQCQAADDVKQFGNLSFVQPVQGGQSGCGPQRSPGAVGMHAHPQFGADAGTRRHVIADDKGAEKLGPGRACLLRSCQQRWEDMHAGMTSCELASLIHFQNGARHSVQKRGSLRIGRPPCSQNGGSSIRLTCVHKRLHVRFGHAADNRTDAVHHHELGAGHCLFGDIVHLHAGNETRHVGQKEGAHRSSRRNNCHRCDNFHQKLLDGEGIYSV